MMAYKFVKHDINPLETLKNSKVYRIREKIDNGIKLSREEKNWITQKVHESGMYGSHGIPLMGWMFVFSDILKTYIIKQYDHLFEMAAVDKTAIRSTLYGRIEYIHELKT